MADWNSTQYIKFKNQRTQPSIDLISRISYTTPKNILDIGCGPGNSTNALVSVFPNTQVTGIDSSQDMLIKARETYPNIHFEHGIVPDDLDKLTEKFDLIFSNACIHWIPNQHTLIKSVLDKVAEGGIFAVQIPLIQEAPFYKLLGELVKTEKWNKLSDIKNFYNLLPEEYYDLFVSLKCEFEMWQTSYYHIMNGYEDIIEWYKGSGLRPYLDILPQDEQQELIQSLLDGLNKYYVLQSDKKVIMKMPRLFFVLKKN